MKKCTFLEGMHYMLNLKEEEEAMLSKIMTLAQKKIKIKIIKNK